MYKEIKSNYAGIDNGSNSMLKVYLNETEPCITNFLFILKNVTINFIKDDIIEVVGERIECDFAFEDTFLEDMKNKPDEKYIKMGYKSIFDFFKGVKKPYVKMGWYKLKTTKPYRCLTSNWYVVL